MTELKIRIIPVSEVPEYILESDFYKDWRDLCPDETMFQLLETMFIENFTINSKEDFDSIIRAESELILSHRTRIQILSNIKKFWLNNPASAQLVLPRKDDSFFGNQVIALLSETDAIIGITCMKSGYLDLFTYLVEECDWVKEVNNNWNLCWSTLYYAAMNDNMEILVYAIEKGINIRTDVMTAAIIKKNIKIIKYLISKGAGFEYSALEELNKINSLEIFTLVIDYNQSLPYNFPPETLLKGALDNIDYLKELLLNRQIVSSSNSEVSDILIKTCITNFKKVNVIQFIREYFHMEDRNLTQIPGITSQMSYKIIASKDYELYMYLRANGFRVHEGLLEEAISRKCTSITPGLIRQHIEDEKTVFRNVSSLLEKIVRI
jgi:hypothetical protein